MSIHKKMSEADVDAVIETLKRIFAADVAHNLVVEAEEERKRSEDAEDRSE